MKYNIVVSQGALSQKCSLLDRLWVVPNGPFWKEKSKYHQWDSPAFRPQSMWDFSGENNKVFFSSQSPPFLQLSDASRLALHPKGRFKPFSSGYREGQALLFRSSREFTLLDKYYPTSFRPALPVCKIKPKCYYCFFHPANRRETFTFRRRL